MELKIEPGLNFLPIWEEETTGPGRQRRESGIDEDDGVKQLFELWFSEASGLNFTEFFRDDLSKSMRFYYQRHYIKEEGKSHEKYLKWKEEWTAAEAAPVDRPKIIQLRAK